MYAGQVEARAAEVWFNTMAAQLDESTALAHSIGLRHLGGADVQLRMAGGSPADAFRELRSAIATLLEGSTLPAPGVTMTIAGAPFVLTPADSVIGLGAVLEAVPGSQAQPAADDKPKRKGRFGRG